MGKKAINQGEPLLPLTEKDWEALDELFKKLEVEVIHQVETVIASYSTAPLEPWEEVGWAINSSFQSVGESRI